MTATLATAKRLAIECQRELRRRMVRPSIKLEREAPKRARKLAGEMVVYWKRNEKLERERRKRAERELEEQRRRESEEREAKRQQRKFNYLITQTELYAHFMRHKAGAAAGENSKMTMSPSATEITNTWVTPKRRHAANPGAADEGTASILTKLDETPDPEGEDDDLKRRALDQVQQAVNAQRERTKAFDMDTARTGDGGAAAAAADALNMVRSAQMGDG